MLHRRGRQIAIGHVAALLVVTVLLAGCGARATPKAVPTPTTQIPAPNPAASTTYSPAQVLGWVTPTLQNGASLVSSLPSTASDASVLAGAQQLAVACGVSQKELTQTTWRGTSLRREQDLAATVAHIQALITSPPTTGLGAALRPVLVTMDSDLAALQRAVGWRSTPAGEVRG